MGGAKLCPTCSVTLAADASGVSFLWTGPNNFTSTEQFPVVQQAGPYRLTVTDLISGCSDFIDVVVEEATNDPCPVMTITPASLTVCSADQVPSITVTTSQGSPFWPTHQVQFVKFSSPQSGTAMYNGGTVLSTVTPANNQAVLVSTVLAPYLATKTAQTFYIYAIVSPTPAQVSGQPDCRPSVSLTVTIRPTECVQIQATRIR